MIRGIPQFLASAREAVAIRPVLTRRAVEATLIALLVVQAGRAAWPFVTPQPAATTAERPTPDLSILSRFDAFFRTGEAGSLAGTQTDAAGQMRLYGVRSGPRGSAIIGLADGRQVSIGVGEEVEPGLVLREVGADHAVLARGEALTRLEFSEVPVGAPSPPPPPEGEQIVAPPPAPAVVDPSRLAGALRPRMQGLSMRGLSIADGPDAALFRGAGLQAGDVILAVDGTELNSPQALASLRTQLADKASVEIRYERDGEARATTLRTRP